jgi:hypothetical protein
VIALCSMKKLILSMSLLTFGSTQSFAGVGHTVADTAPVVAKGEYRGKLVADILLNNGGGLNITPRFTTGLVDQFVDITGILGAGKTDWQIGAVGKYNLLPDVPGQVALSFLGSLRLLGGGGSTFSIGTGMLVSKQMNASFGNITPYGSLELDFVFVDGTTIPIHLNAGAHWAPYSMAPWSFTTEVQLGLARGTYAIGLGTQYNF